MKHLLVLLILIVGMSGILVFTYATQAETEPVSGDRVCLEQRAVEFGWTAEYVGLAEMAAIIRWQEAVAETDPGYANWHQAGNRYLVCLDINGSDHKQCEVSARPCRYEDG